MAEPRDLPIVPSTWDNQPEFFRLVEQAINAVINGRSNAVGTVTLRANQTTTVVADRRFMPRHRVQLEPATANAAAAVTSVYTSSKGQRTFTLTHDSDAATDRTFNYALQG